MGGGEGQQNPDVPVKLTYEERVTLWKVRAAMAGWGREEIDRWEINLDYPKAAIERLEWWERRLDTETGRIRTLP